MFSRQQYFCTVVANFPAVVNRAEFNPGCSDCSLGPQASVYAPTDTCKKTHGQSVVHAFHIVSFILLVQVV